MNKARNMNTKKPSVAAAIVSFNHKPQVVKLLAELDALGVPASVTENASSDGTLNAIQGKFSRVTILESRHNLGGTGGFNCAVLSALSLGTDYILLLDDDAMPKGDCIKVLADFLDQNKEYVFASPSIHISSRPFVLQETGGRVHFSKRLPVEAWNRFAVNPKLPDIIDIDYASACCLMVRSEAIRKTGVMDWNYFIFSDDVDWCLRLTRAGRKGACVTTARADHDFPWAKPFSPARLYYFQRNGLYMISKLRKGANNSVSLFFALFRIIRDLIHSRISGDHEIFFTLKAAVTHSFARQYGKWRNPVSFGTNRQVFDSVWFNRNRVSSVLIDITIEDWAENVVETVRAGTNKPLQIDILCDWNRVEIFKQKHIFSKVIPRRHGIFPYARAFFQLRKLGYDLVITDAFMFPRRVTSHSGKRACIFHDNKLYSAPCRPWQVLVFSFLGPVLAIGMTVLTLFHFLKRPTQGMPPPEAAPILEQLGYDPEKGQP